ncbi:MAG: hypothetical protein IPK80_19680 [Nannocystis sp.]|nr:hypothetical protein [Nannocystis sp.]
MTEATAVVGFKNLDDLRTIIFTYGEFRTAEEVGLKLPRPIVETLTVQMDDEQEAKYRIYVRQIEEALENPNPDGPSNLILGLLARLALVALHPALDEGYSFRTALAGGESKRTNEKGEEYTVRLPRPSYSSPKLEECARRVVASPHCGHIIFVEPTAVHVWMKEVLVDAGIPRERIAWLNSDVSTIERSTIARQFNGLSAEQPEPGTCSRPSDSAVAPKYDVIIANSVAYEGIDLQVRTCSIHHLDLPWTPADLEQRNGRGVRQGNTLGVINIYYYFADGSSDGYRFSLIDGKANWLGQLIKSSVRDTNNPSAQQQLTPEDIMLMVSRDKESAPRPCSKANGKGPSKSGAPRSRARPLVCSARRSPATRVPAPATTPTTPPSSATKPNNVSPTSRASTATHGPGKTGCGPRVSTTCSSPKPAPPPSTRASASRAPGSAPPTSSNTSSSAGSAPPATRSPCAPPAPPSGASSPRSSPRSPPTISRAKAVLTGPTTTTSAPATRSRSASTASCATSTISAGSARATPSSKNSGPASSARSPPPSRETAPRTSPSSRTAYSPSARPTTKTAAPSSRPPSPAGAAT